MTYDVLLNFILAGTRIVTFAISAVVLFNLVADLRNSYQKEHRNGVWSTRVTLIVLMLALVIENLVYILAYLHGNFVTDGLNQWLTAAKPFLIVARAMVMVSVIIIYRLFCCTKQKRS